MEKIQILVVGRNPEILATVVRLVNNNLDWNATGCLSDEEAIAAFPTQDFKVVLLGGGVDEVSESKLNAHFCIEKPDIKIIQHFGGGSGLLSAEIFEALN